MEKIIVPDIGDFDKVEIIDILVKEGDTVDTDAGVIVLETDKASVEIPAGIAGIVSKMLVKIGDKVSTGDSIAELQSVSEQKHNTTSANINKDAEKKVVVKDSIESVKQQLLLPDLGADGEFNVVELLVKPGDTIELEQPIVVLEGDKASMEVPATVAGKILSIDIKAGDALASHALIGAIEVVSDIEDKIENNVPGINKITNKPPTVVEPTNDTRTNANDDDFGSDLFAGPATRRLAHSLKIRSSDIGKGSGKRGRIILEDIIKFAEQKLSHANTGSKQAALLPEIDHSKFGAVTEEKRSRIQQLSASNLQSYWVNIPHVTIFEDCDITDLEDFRQQYKNSYKDRGIRLTMLAFIIKAVTHSLIKHPKFNASINNSCDTLTLKHYYNIGVAVDTPNGLVVPVVLDADKKSISQIANDIAKLSVKARDGKLPSSAYKGHTFTISSLGGIGSTGFTPIVNYPDVAILGVAKSSIKPFYKNGNLQPRLMLPLALSFDHRAIDGAAAAKFMKTLQALLEDIKTIIL